MSSDAFVMSSRQSAELDYAFERNGWMAGDVKWLSEGDNLAKVLEVRRGNADIVPASILKFVGTVTIPARTTQFVPKDAFVVNTKTGSHVKISYVNPDFIEYFGDKIEKSTAETTLRYHELSRSSTFALVVKELGNEVVVKTTPGELYSMMEMQPDGPKSDPEPLLVNGYVQLFKMDDVSDISRLVSVGWGVDGWCVAAGPAPRSLERSNKYRVFSRDSR